MFQLFDLDSWDPDDAMDEAERTIFLAALADGLRQAPTVTEVWWNVARTEWWDEGRPVNCGGGNGSYGHLLAEFVNPPEDEYGTFDEVDAQRYIDAAFDAAISYACDAT